ncbi:GNAT family N-acetyltransferase [Pontibacter sp. JH31]|uniref:GNAT family N-acetyltransferase n=1 Tax=Pontibacter aquaedesilientis TaxID=2766980 RepID=A0ABR7XHF3_9BACT|nr:GNAT family N-acetyltransferase [Pontibacter aquaedesilientis]MBD1397724.1 GNAT family N-acetyltransferase [Pontibacter aquaedesilientis]
MQTIVDHDIATSPIVVKGLEICVGKDVFELLSDQDFQSGWDALYEACPWGTVFQSRGFVGAWYRTYRERYLPVLALTRGPGGRLTGLLALAQAGAQPAAGAPLLGAGHFEAEYQCWLADGQAQGEVFITAALEQLGRRFARSPVLFRFLPPGAPLDWARTDPGWRSRCVLQAARRPLMEMDDPGLPKLFRKSEFMNKLNRLRRLGEVRLERVTDAGAFSAVLGELAVQYDFRQGALYNKNRFRENPRKAIFLQELFEQGIVHATVLKVNGEIIAAIAAIISKDWVHLGGINIHSPMYANYYSPGFVHFIMLGQLLSKEDVACFDLTPGGDSYKERMATTHDYVYELVVSNKLSFFFKKQIKNKIHNRLIRAGLRPMSVELAIRKKIYLLKKKTGALLSSGLSLLFSKIPEPKTKFYNIPVAGLAQIDTNVSLNISYNKLEDLLNYEDSGSLRTRWEFLSEAMRRFESGERCYTWGAGGRLLACAWQGAARAGGPVPEGAPVLRGLYCHRTGRSGLANFLAAVARKVIQASKGKQPAVICSDKAIGKVLKQLGTVL